MGCISYDFDKSDVANAYRLFLGRDAENATVIEEKVGITLSHSISEFIGCKEFHTEVALPAISGQQFKEGRFGGEVDSLRAWVTQELDINNEAIASSRNRPALLAAVLEEPSCRAYLQDLSRGWSLNELCDALKVAREGTHYDTHLLHLMLNRIYDLPDIVVDHNAPIRVNILVPAFEFKSMSAGFFGVFQVARFIALSGNKVRLVLFDNFAWNEIEFRDKIQGYPELENLSDEVEIEYIGERLRPLIISPQDNCVATVWYSAYLAEKIMRATSKRPFIYLIQDYETRFHPSSTHAAAADATYEMDYAALFSSEPLMQFFQKQGIGAFAHRPVRAVYFSNACSSRLAPREDFIKRRNITRTLALYSRPVVARNMFELAALALSRALDEGVFEGREWNFYGIGLGGTTIEFKSGRSLKQLPRMNLRDYVRAVGSFDLGLSLMASPHPSLLPFDLGGSGAIVVTNTWETKQQSYFDSICTNIIAKPPTLDMVVGGLREAVKRVEDFEARHDAAMNMNYPLNWGQVFHAEHVTFLSDVLNN